MALNQEQDNTTANIRFPIQPVLLFFPLMRPLEKYMDSFLYICSSVPLKQRSEVLLYKYSLEVISSCYFRGISPWQSPCSVSLRVRLVGVITVASLFTDREVPHESFTWSVCFGN